MASGGVRVMEKPPIQLQQQPQLQAQSQEALKCPRCDSSNTKFCYYNNYSLSQPRHFCKACKRYWTRGGTLRNVPVGGGCRKNKRVKRPITTPPPPAAANHQTNPNPNPNPDHNNQIIPSSSTTSNSNMSNHHLNPLFYGLLPQNPNYPRFDSTSIISETAGSLVSGGYDLLQPHHINAAAASGLGFSGALVAANHGHINSNLTFSSYMNVSPPMYAGGGSTSSSIASLLASSLTSQQQRFMGFASAYDRDNDEGGSNSMVVKDLKIEEEAQNRRSMDQQWNNFHGQNNKNDHQAQQMMADADPNSLIWDTSTDDNQGGVWLNDPTNNIIGSSVPSLI